MPSHLILIRQPGLRDISEDDVRAALGDEQRALKHRWIDVDMRPFQADVEGGFWEAQDIFLRERADAVRLLADDFDDPEIHYFGLAEVPQIIAFGAYVGLERKIVVHDFDRASGRWIWPGGSPRRVAAEGLPPEGYETRQRGILTLRIEISYPVAGSDVSEAVGDENFPPVFVRLVGEDPGLGKIRSVGDLESAREEVRRALARIRAAYPNLEEIHLFAAVPTSVAFVLGQELVPRNSPPIETYRYRHAVEGRSQRRAILICGEPSQTLEGRPLDSVARARAQAIRETLWAEELENLRAYANALPRSHGDALWYGALDLAPALSDIPVFPQLRPLPDVIPPRSRVEPKPHPAGREFGYVEGTWSLSDELVLDLADDARGDAAHRRRIRLFLLHEHVHYHQLVTSDTAEEVGKFANALEHVDYVADVYALLHEFDLSIRQRGSATGDEDRLALLLECLEEVIRSFWAFERRGQVQWEVRRLRRHLNWYWQLARIGETRTVRDALRVLARKPVVELAGMRYRTHGRRVLVDLHERDPTTSLEIAAVLDDESLDRQGQGGQLDPERLCRALVDRDHDAAKAYFRGLVRYMRERSRQ